VRIGVLAYAAVVATLLGSAIFRITERRAGWLVFLIANSVWFAEPALVQCLTPDLWFGDWIAIRLADTDLFRAASLISLFFFIGTSSYWLIAPPDCGSRRHVAPWRGPNRFAAALLLSLAFLPYAMSAYENGPAYVISTLLAGRGDKPWYQAALYATDVTNTVYWLCRASLVALGALSLTRLLCSPAGRHRAANAALAVVCMVIIFVEQGTRSLTAMLALPPIFAALLGVGQGLRRRLLWFGPIAVAILLILTQVQLYFRTAQGRAQLQGQSLASTLNLRQQTDFFTETALAASIPLQRGYLHEVPEWVFIVNVIPRTFWPEKPTPRTYWVYSFYRWGRDVFETGGNALPSVVGQYYMNWGIPGVVWIGSLVGASLALLDAWLRRALGRPELMLAPLAWMVFVFLAFRYFGPGFHYPALWLTTLWLPARHARAMAAVARRGFVPVRSRPVGRSPGQSLGPGSRWGRPPCSVGRPST